MKIYNKFVESKKEPSNKSDIWFDGSSWNMYKEGMWRAFTLPLDAAERITKMLEEFKLFKIVSSLPQVGEDNIIYLVESINKVEGNSLIEYIYINNAWEAIGKFTPTLELDDYLKISDSPFEKGSGENSAVLKNGNNKATNANEVALGKYNISNSDTKFSIGIGTSNTNRKNAVEVKQNGDIYIEGVEGKIQDKLNVIDNIATINGQSIINGGNIEIKGGGESYDDTEIRNEISLRNVSAVAIDEEVEEPEDKYATKGYVDEAINSAIVVVLNTEV